MDRATTIDERSPAAPGDRPDGGRALLFAAGRHLLLARAVEDAGHRLYLQGRIPGSFYRGRGQEATAVGAAMAMGPRDVACPLIRDMAVHLVRGITPREVLLHYLARAGSPTGGREANVHLGDLARGTVPMVSHLPEIVPVGIGIALGRRWRGEEAAALVFCGDGGANGGVWHETMNLAAVWRAPAVMVVERNGWAYMTPSASTLAGGSVAARAAGYGIPSVEVDGNDVLAVHDAAAVALARARAGEGPTLIEATTYRVGGHGSHDGAAYQPQDERARWEAHDPLAVWRERAIAAGLAADGLDRLREEAEAEVAAAVAAALEAPEPTYDAASQQVFG